MHRMNRLGRSGKSMVRGRTRHDQANGAAPRRGTSPARAMPMVTSIALGDVVEEGFETLHSGTKTKVLPVNPSHNNLREPRNYPL
jgi:hypothetical protein